MSFQRRLALISLRVSLLTGCSPILISFIDLICDEGSQCEFNGYGVVSTYHEDFRGDG